MAGVLLLPAVVSCGSTAGNGGDKCQPDDADGVNGVNGSNVTFQLSVDESGFSPAILPAQNLTNVTLTLSNKGTKPHDFVIDCLPSPNDDGCPTTSCFPPSTSIPTIAPGASATAMFLVPNTEGLYYYHSDLPDDAATPCTMGAKGCGQFDVK